MAGNNSVHYGSGAWSSEDAQWLEDGKINSSSPLSAQHPFPLPHPSSSPSTSVLLSWSAHSAVRHSGPTFIWQSAHKDLWANSEEITLSIKLEENTFPVQDGTWKVDRFLAMLKTRPVCGPLLKVLQL